MLRERTSRHITSRHAVVWTAVFGVVLALGTVAAFAGGLLGYEDAYVDGTTVRINAIEVKQNPTDKAQADFYEVVYPFDPATGQELTAYWPGNPMCNPCDHQGNGITPDDFHDHVLDSQPTTGHGEYNALWHVYLIMPNYSRDAAHNANVDAALQSMLPAKSEAAVNAILATMVDGVPLANKIDTQFYFICDVVSPNAGAHH
jgi:hypothetical protein